MANLPFFRVKWWLLPSAWFLYTVTVHTVKTVSTTWKSRLRKVDEIQPVPVKAISNCTNRAGGIN